MGSPEVELLTPDGSQMGISVMAGILVSLGVVRIVPGGTLVDMGFERCFVVDYATGWDMDDEEQTEEVERRVRDEEPVLLIGSLMCRAFGSSIELTRATNKFERGQVQEPRGAMRKTP